MNYDKQMTIIEIDDYLVSSEILTEYFACDYEDCKGCCCIIGESGAPLKDIECLVLANEFDSFKEYLSQQELSVIEERGFYEIDDDGDVVTPLMTGGQECVYTCFDDKDNCFCAIEKAYIAGKTDFRKPISCWIYPIRVSTLSNGLIALNLHRWQICTSAFDRGKKERIKVYQFLKDPIIHLFGEEFYEALEEVDAQIMSNQSAK